MITQRRPELIGWLPAIAFAAVWAAQLVYRTVVVDLPFDPLQGETIVAIATAVVSFLVGCVVVMATSSGDRDPPEQDDRVAPDGGVEADGGHRGLRLSLLAAAAAFIWINVLRPLASSGLDLASLRNDVLDAWSEGDPWSRVQAVLVNSVACWLVLLFTERYRRTRRFDAALAGAFVVISVAAFSRTLLLIGCITAFVSLLAESDHPLRLVLGTGLVFGALFAALALALRPDEESGPIAEFVFTHLQAYLFGGVAGLNTFVATGTPTYATFLTAPRFAQALLGSPEPPPPYFEFVETPVRLNVFTSIYPPLHDFGLVGVAAYFLLFGVITTAVSARFARTRHPAANVAAGFFLYATAMSVFDDQFVRGMPVFLIWVAAAAAFGAVARREREQRAEPPDASGERAET